jgi:hypothetical protein
LSRGWGARLGALFGLAAGEGPRVRWLVALSALLALPQLYTAVSAEALFLARFGPSQLPLAYVAMAGAVAPHGPSMWRDQHALLIAGLKRQGARADRGQEGLLRHRKRVERRRPAGAAPAHESRTSSGRLGSASMASASAAAGSSGLSVRVSLQRGRFCRIDHAGS